MVAEAWFTILMNIIDVKDHWWMSIVMTRHDNDLHDLCFVVGVLYVWVKFERALRQTAELNIVPGQDK